MKRDLALAGLVFFLALLPRARDLDVILTPDETRWICRSTNFYAGLATGELARTYQKEHPGVITMWLGSLGMPTAPTAQYARACRDVEPSKLVTSVDHVTLDTLRDRLFAGRMRVAIVVAAGIAGMYLLAAGLLGRRAALLGAVLLAFEPLYLAQSRVLHLDALTTTFLALSVIALLRYLLADPRERFLVAAGVFAGLAALNKSPGLFVVPFSGLVLVVHGVRTRATWRTVAGRVAAWSLAAGATYVLLWPVMWVAPLEAVTGVIRGALGYAEDPHEGSNYFWGAIRPDPGPAFYPVSWLLRTTPIVLLGLILTGVAALRRRLDPMTRAAVLALLAFAVLFTLFMTTGAKKFDRYLLPTYPALTLTAAVGWAWALGRIERRAARVGAVAAVCVAAAALALPHHPYYLSYYNPAFGGAPAARWALLVGWGEGLEQIAAHLNAREDASDLTVATRYRSAFGPLFRGRALEMDDYDPASLDYYLLYLNQVQRDLDPEVIASLQSGASPEVVARFRGMDYAWLYPNENYVPVLEHITEHGRPGDGIVVRADSQLAKHYDGPLPVVAIEPDADAEALRRRLERAFREHDRLWYVRYDDIYPRPGLAAVDFDLATGVFALSESRFPEVTLRLLAADAPVQLGAGPPPMAPAEAAFEVAGDEPGRGRLALAGYTLGDTPVRWGRELGIWAEWLLASETDRRLTAFLHLIGPDGTRWAQVDRPIADPDLRPTDEWAGGARFVDRYHLGIPAGTPPGTYRLHVGVYDAETGERLAARVDGKAAEVFTVPVEVGRPPFAPEPDALDLTARSGAVLHDGIELLGIGVVGGVEGGHEAPLTLLWRADRAPAEDYRARLTVRDPTGAVVGETTTDPTTTAFPTSEWQPGDVVRGWVSVPLDGRARAGAGTVSVALVGPVGEVFGETVVLPLEITGPARVFDADAFAGVPVDARLGDVAVLRAAEIPRRDVAPGAAATITLTWQSAALTDVSYTVFAQALASDGRVVAQSDRPPSRETTAWLPGEIVVDPVMLSLPEGLPPGRYRVIAGLYDPATVVRLPATDASGMALPDDAVPLGAIEVGP